MRLSPVVEMILNRYIDQNVGKTIPILSMSSVHDQGLSNATAGLIFLNFTEPANLEQVGYASDDGHVHNAQCLVYKGPDKRYQGHEVCHGYNEDSLTIYDVTDKKWSEIISLLLTRELFIHIRNGS